MARFLAMRLVQGAITLFVLATLVFVLSHLIGNPVTAIVGAEATVDEQEAMSHELGLDRPYYVQYGDYMGHLLRGDAGLSHKFNVPVTTLFLSRFLNTAGLAGAAIVIAIVFGFALGMTSAVYRGTALDHLSRALSVIGMSAPTFWLGLMLILVFAVQFRILPVARMDGPASYILPAFTLSFVTLAGIARLVRSSMLEVLDSEYVKLARIKGVSPFMVVWKHCLSNALLPVLTFAGVHLADLLNGSVAIEAVFAWPGVGRLIYEGIVARDYPLVQGCLLIVGFIIIIINLLVDASYAYIDPRVRITGGR